MGVHSDGECDRCGIKAPPAVVRSVLYGGRIDCGWLKIKAERSVSQPVDVGAGPDGEPCYEPVFGFESGTRIYCPKCSVAVMEALLESDEPDAPE